MWKKHQDDDQLANLTEKFAATRLGTTDASELQQSLEAVQNQVIQSQEADIAASLATGQSYPPLSSLTRSTPGQQSLLRMEEMDMRLKGLLQDVEGFSTLSLERNAGGVLSNLDAIAQRIHQENDKLKIIRQGCGGDRALLEVHSKIEDRIRGALEKLSDSIAFWTEVEQKFQVDNDTSGVKYDTGESLNSYYLHIFMKCSAHHFYDNLRQVKPLIQLSIFMVVCCSVILNLSWRGCSWLFDVTRLIIQTTILKAISLVNDLVLGCSIIPREH